MHEPICVSLHGSNGFATRDLGIWSPYLQNLDSASSSCNGGLAVEIRRGDCCSTFDIYREIDLLSRRKGIQPGSVMLHGFSRSSANIYAVAALDRSKGPGYFSLIVANAGGASLNYPPTRSVDSGRFGASPYRGLRWITVCGERGPNPDLDGCPAMRHTAERLKKNGGEVAFAIEDANEGHGAFHRNPQNVGKTLDWFQQN